MKFLIDENVSNSVFEALKQIRIDVIYIADKNSTGLSDIQVFKKAIDERRIIITRDYHFSNPLLFPPDKTKGIIYIRHGNLSSVEEKEIVIRFIKSDFISKIEGKFITLYKDKFLIRE